MSFLFAIFAVLGISQIAQAGYAQVGGYPSIVQSVIPSFIGASFPAVNLVQKRPLQLRPPQATVPVVATAVPNTAPPVTVIHAARPPALPVVAIQAQQSIPNYSFGYAVKDLTTGDEKSHEESRNGDNVIGKYTVVEPDGTLRTVTYTAGVNGFNAVVQRTPGYAPPNAPVLTKPVAIAPPQFIAVSRPSIPISAVSQPITISRPSLGLPPGAPSIPASAYPHGFHFGG